MVCLLAQLQCQQMQLIINRESSESLPRSSQVALGLLYVQRKRWTKTACYICVVRFLDQKIVRSQAFPEMYVLFSDFKTSIAAGTFIIKLFPSVDWVLFFVFFLTEGATQTLKYTTWSCVKSFTVMKYTLKKRQLQFQNLYIEQNS